MKKTLIKLGLSLALANSMAMADGAKFFKKENGMTGGMVGNTVIFFYDNNEAAKVKDSAKLNIINKIMKKQICEGEDTSGLIKLGYHVLFVYPDSEGNRVVLEVTSCD
jgi:hypothetical protein